MEGLSDFDQIKLHDSLAKIRSPISEILRYNLNSQVEIENTLKSLDVNVDNNYG